MLLKSLLAASEGRIVCVVCFSNSHAKETFRRAAELCQREATVSYSQHCISFEDAGKCYFSYGEFLSLESNAIKPDVVFKDAK